MYLIERLTQVMIDRPETVDGIIAGALLSHPARLTHYTSRTFSKELGISKASLHRFYSKGGFSTFHALCESIESEVNLHKHSKTCDPSKFRYRPMELAELANAIAKADSVVFYGNFNEIDMFQMSILHMIQKGIHVQIARDWDLESAIQKMDQLKEQDVLIYLDCNMGLDILPEYTLNHENFIAFETIQNTKGKHFYISRKKSRNDRGFHQIECFAQATEYIRPYLFFADQQLCEYLRKET